MFSGNVNYGTPSVVNNIEDIVVKGSTVYGSFGNAAGKGVDVDANNANWIRDENLPQYWKDSSVIIAQYPGGGNAWRLNDISVMRHKNKGFLYYGDSGFTREDVLNMTEYANNPGNLDNTAVVDATSTYGNAQLLGNVFVWAVQRANLPEFGYDYKVKTPCTLAAEFLATIPAAAGKYWFCHETTNAANVVSCGYSTAVIPATGAVNNIPANQTYEYDPLTRTWTVRTATWTLPNTGTRFRSNNTDTLNCP
jgi:hypothetical protein